MKNQTPKFVLLFSLAALTIFACGVSAPSPTATIDVAEVETIVASTLQAVTPPASATVAVPATNPPALVTATSAPTKASVPVTENATRIQFATGATSGIQEGQIQAGQSRRFLIGAAAGQPLMVSVGSPNNDVTFSVTGVNGSVLLSAAQKLSSWQTTLTTTQDYRIEIYGGASTGSFTLSVTAPARISFDPGAVSAKLSGSTAAGFNVAYVLRASANQKMKLSLSTLDGNAVLSMYGYQDGQPYLRYVVEQTDFDFTLPATQDYIIQVVPRGGEVAQYVLTVEVK